MTLRTKKRLLNVASLLLLAGGGALFWSAWRGELPVASVEANAASGRPASIQSPSAAPIALEPGRWNRTLRRPLYDPPPPPKQEVVIPPRPITVKLVGTVLEGENSQAFIRQQNGKVDIKRLGDQVTPEAADGVIAAITGADVVIRREDGEHRLAVEGRN